MKIYETSVRKPISVILIFVGAIVLGLFSLTRLSIDLMPEMEIPTLSLLTSYPGASAVDIEQNVTKILEDNLNTVSNLKKITSKSQDNLSLVTLEFEWGSNLDEASNDVRDVIGRVQSLLPDDVEQPMLFKFSTSMIPIMYLSATANESYQGLNKLLEEKIANPLNRINGVGAVSISGAPIREIQINVDPNKLEAYKLTVEQIGSIIAQENINMPAGSLDIGNERSSLRIESEFLESNEVKNIVVANYGGKEIHISDVADVKDTIHKMTLLSTVDGKPGVMLVIQKQSGANSVGIANKIKKALPELQKTLPADVHVDVMMDTTTNITNSINSLSETVMYAFIFVVLVVLFFLGRWRATFIIVLTIPVSLISGFVYLLMTGGSINIISLSSLSIAIGMVVDDAIVVLENITKHIERGSKPKDAAIYATNEVWLAVIATTLTVVAVFWPLTMVSGMAGIMFKQLGWIVTITILISTLAAITLTPMLSAKLLNVRASHTYKGLGILFRPIEQFLERFENGYERLLTWVVRHRTVTIIGSFAIFIASLALLSRVPTELFPASDNGTISASFELPSGSGLEYTKSVADQVQKEIREACPEIRTISQSVGADDKATIAALFGGSTGSHGVSYNIQLKDLKSRSRSMFEIGDVMRKIFAKYPELVKYSVDPGGRNGGGFGGSSTVDVKVFGYDLEAADIVANQVAELMKDVPGTRDIKISRDKMVSQMRVEFDRDRLAQFGMNTVTASTFVYNRINGMTASKFREDGNEYDIVVRYDDEFRTSVEDIENILLYNSKGQAIRLREVAKVTEAFAPPTIEHENRQRVITVSASLYGAALGDVAAATQKEVAQMMLPAGIEVTLGGSIEDQQESFQDLLTLLMLIIVLVYIVMAVQFESFRMPFIIMLSIPFAFTGVFLALWVSGTPLSMIAFVGAIMLVGIVVKNGIVMVDFTNLQRERGMSISTSVITAGKSRLRPVLMTTLTTILGMVPLAFGSGEGSETWKPMGIAIIGGLTFSTILTLLVIPAIYSSFSARGLKKQRKESLEN